MTTERASGLRQRLEAWRGRSLRARVADSVLGAFIALLAIALIVNSAADVRTAHRMRLDGRVMHEFLAARGLLAYYGPPTARVHRRTDLVCVIKHRAPGQLRFSEGYCLVVVSSPDSSRAIALSYRCIVIPPAPAHSSPPVKPPLPPGTQYCPYRGSPVT